MNISQEKLKTFEDEMDRWMRDKSIDLRKSCNDKDLEILKRLDVKYESPLCSEFEFGILLRRVYDYYDFEKLKNKKNLTNNEKRLLDDFINEQTLWEECVRKGYMTKVGEQKKLTDTGVSEVDYKILLTKLENINFNIKLQKKIRRIEKKQQQQQKILNA